MCDWRAIAASYNGDAAGLEGRCARSEKSSTVRAAVAAALPRLEPPPPHTTSSPCRRGAGERRGGARGGAGGPVVSSAGWYTTRLVSAPEPVRQRHSKTHPARRRTFPRWSTRYPEQTSSRTAPAKTDRSRVRTSHWSATNRRSVRRREACE